MNKLSFDIKHMYRASTGNKFILAVRDKVTNYLVAIPLYGGTSHKVREALIIHMLCKHGPFLFDFDEDQGFSSSVLQYIYKRLDIKINTISPYNHGSLKQNDTL